MASLFETTFVAQSVKALDEISRNVDLIACESFEIDCETGLRLFRTEQGPRQEFPDAETDVPDRRAKPEEPRPRPLYNFPYLKVENTMLFFARTIATTD